MLPASLAQHTESDSDSGESLFITQKPVPEAVRSGRRLNHDLLSNLSPTEDVVESRTGSRTVKKDRRKECKLPTYTFPFLAKERRRRRPRGDLPTVRDKSLNNSVMGGFFKCVRELQQQGYMRVDDLDSPRATVDMEGDYIPPLSEAAEMSEDEDIRVVENKCFVKPSKRISRQTWCTHVTRQRRWQVGNAGQETSPGAQNKMSNETPAEASISRAAALSLHTESSDDRGTSCGVLMERKRNGEHTTNDSNFLAQEETRKAKTHLTQTCKHTTEEESCNVTVCEPGQVHRGPRQYTRKDKEAATEPQNDALYTDYLSQTGLMEDKPESQSIRHVTKATQVNERSAVKSLSGDATDMRQEMGNIPDSKQKKKKKVKSASEHFRQEVDGSLETGEGMKDSMFSVSCQLENIGKKKEKKRKRRDEDAAQSQSSAAVERLNDDAEIRMDKKQRKKEMTVIVEEECEEKEASNKTSDYPPMSTKRFKESSAGLKNTAPFEKTMDSSYAESKRHKKKLQSAFMDVSQDREEFVGESLSNDAGTLKESTGAPQKKKKRKRRDEDAAQSPSSAAVERLNDDAEIRMDKKQRKKETTVIVEEECEEKEASNKTSDYPPMSTKRFKESSAGLKNTAPFGKTMDSSYAESKRHKKKLQSASMDVSQDREEFVGESLSNDAGTLKESTGAPQKKKKKRKRDDEDLLQSSSATDPLNAEYRQKRKKEEKCDEKQASNRTSELSLMSKEQFEQSGNYLENTAASGTLGRGHIKRKKHKRRQQVSSMDVCHQDREEGVGVNCCNDAGTLKEGTGTPLKKKKKKGRKRPRMMILRFRQRSRKLHLLSVNKRSHSIGHQICC